jgi:hypothetical protein
MITEGTQLTSSLKNWTRAWSDGEDGRFTVLSDWYHLFLSSSSLDYAVCLVVVRGVSSSSTIMACLSFFVLLCTTQHSDGTVPIVSMYRIHLYNYNHSTMLL